MGLSVDWKSRLGICADILAALAAAAIAGYAIWDSRRNEWLDAVIPVLACAMIAPAAGLWLQLRLGPRMLRLMDWDLRQELATTLLQPAAFLRSRLLRRTFRAAMPFWLSLPILLPGTLINFGVDPEGGSLCLLMLGCSTGFLGVALAGVMHMALIACRRRKRGLFLWFVPLAWFFIYPVGVYFLLVLLDDRSWDEDALFILFFFAANAVWFAVHLLRRGILRHYFRFE